MPPGAVKVDRTTTWGNPFVPGRVNAWIGRTVIDRADAFTLYRAYAVGNEALVRKARLELRGKQLACWCAPDDPCHASILLELANADEADARPMANEDTT